MGFMSNFSIPSGIAMALLVLATIMSIVSMATKHWEEMELKMPNIPGMDSLSGR